MTEPKQYGVYSQGFVDMGYPTSIYLTPDGNEVEVCGIYDTPDCSRFKWKDRVLLGEIVGEQIRPGLAVKSKEWTQWNTD